MFKATNLVRLSRLTRPTVNCRPLTLSTNFDCTDPDKCRPILDSFYLIEDFISEEEEQNLLVQCEKLLKRRRYENSHFDYAIHQYKEVEFKDWNEINQATIQRIKELGFSTSEPLLNAPLSARVKRLTDSGNSNFKLKSEANCQPLSQSDSPSNEPHRDRLSNDAKSTQEPMQSFSRQSAQQSAQPIDQSVCQPTNQSVNQQFAMNQQRLTVGNAINGSTENSNEPSDKTDKSCNRESAFRIIPEVHILDLRKDGYIKPHVDAVRFCGSRIVGVSLLSNAIMRLANTEDKSASVDALLKRRSLYLMADFARYQCTHEILADEESNFRGQHVERDRRISIIARCMPDKNVQEKL